jgi:MoaA/NifB/PqqE/SkfB family radical SAM enzyme
MNNKLIKKEMSLDDFKKTLLKMKRNPKIKVVKLLGGEPTLHSKFKEIINLSLKYFPYVQIFTNGIFSDDLANFLISKATNVSFTFNITKKLALNNEIFDRRLIKFNGIRKDKFLLHLKESQFRWNNRQNIYKLLTE